MYDVCENLANDQTEEILKKLKKLTPVQIHLLNPSPSVLKPAKHILKKAGHNYGKTPPDSLQHAIIWLPYPKYPDNYRNGGFLLIKPLFISSLNQMQKPLIRMNATVLDDRSSYPE